MLKFIAHAKKIKKRRYLALNSASPWLMIFYSLKGNWLEGKTSEELVLVYISGWCTPVSIWFHSVWLIKHLLWNIYRARLLDLFSPYATNIQVSTDCCSLVCLSWRYNSQITPVWLLHTEEGGTSVLPTTSTSISSLFLFV